MISGLSSAVFRFRAYALINLHSRGFISPAALFLFCVLFIMNSIFFYSPFGCTYLYIN